MKIEYQANTKQPDKRRLWCYYCQTKVEWHSEIEALPPHIVEYLLLPEVCGRLSYTVFDRNILAEEESRVVNRSARSRKIEKRIQYEKLNILLESLRQYNFLSRWACKKCVKKLAGVYSNPHIHFKTYYGEVPYLVFIDEIKQCSCGEQFIFSKMQKQYIYEKIRLSTSVVRSSCLKCRLKKENDNYVNKILSEKRTQEELNDPNVLLKIASLHLKVENYKKAELLLRRAKNIFKKQGKTFEMLEHFNENFDV